MGNAMNSTEMMRGETDTVSRMKIELEKCRIVGPIIVQDLERDHLDGRSEGIGIIRACQKERLVETGCERDSILTIGRRKSSISF